MEINLNKKPKPVVYGAPPRVNLLPVPERRRRALANLQRQLVFGVLAVLALTAVMFAAAYAMRVQAESSLSAAEDQKTSLQGQIAKYSDVSALVAERDNLISKRATALADDMDWSEPHRLLAPALPTGARLTGFMGATGGPPTGEEGEIGIKAVATVVSAKPIDQATILDRFSKVAHVIDVDMLGLQKDEGVYTYSIYVAFDQEMYGTRFQIKADAEGDTQ